MSDIASDFADRLEDLGVGTVGTDIFVGQLPEETNGVYIVRTGGLLNNYVPIEETMLDVYVQDTSSQSAINTIEDIKMLVHRTYEYSTDNNVVYTILVMSDVVDLGRDQEYGKTYKISVQLRHRKLTIIS